MRVLVTGTSGRIGSVTAREFLEHGYTVRGLDIRPAKEDLRGDIENVYVDLTDRLGLLRAAEGCDAIAHLAAIPSPQSGEENIFATNVMGTQYVLNAAEAHGIKRVALASTCCAFGIFFALRPIDPQYLPMDEKHPALPQDMYGLSKVLNEETAAAYTRRCVMTTTCLRLTTVMDFQHARWREWWRHGLASDENRRNDLWSYVDVRDVARAFRLAIENAPEGEHHTVILAARDSFTAHDIRHQVRRHFPALASQVENLAPDASLYDTTAAERVIGWIAERNWRDVPEFANITPSIK
jgi:nucleoside-diphosphate-sugar epimerase